MIARKLIAGAALSIVVLTGAGGALAANQSDPPPDQACYGQHVSDMARHHGGMRAATDHHNAMHGTQLSVGEHMAAMRSGDLCEMGPMMPMRQDT